MSDLCYCQYAFAQPDCRVQAIGPGVDPHFQVELLCDGPIAAVVSRASLDQLAPERLQGKTADDLQWLGTIAARHHEIVCSAALSSAVLPLRLGTLFRSIDSLQAMLVRCRSTVAMFLEQLGDRQEWGIKLYLQKRPLELAATHAGTPTPHYLAGSGPTSDDEAAANEGPSDNMVPSPIATSGTSYLTRKMAQRDGRRELRSAVNQTIQRVEQQLAGATEHCCRINNLSSDLTGRREEMVYNAAYLLPSSERASWLNTVQQVQREVQGKGLALEVSGPWPPYHFCPSLES